MTAGTPLLLCGDDLITRSCVIFPVKKCFERLDGNAPPTSKNDHDQQDYAWQEVQPDLCHHFHQVVIFYKLKHGRVPRQAMK
jgi:hypothetical protein